MMYCPEPRPRFEDKHFNLLKSVVIKINELGALKFIACVCIGM